MYAKPGTHPTPSATVQPSAPVKRVVRWGLALESLNVCKTWNTPSAISYSATIDTWPREGNSQSQHSRPLHVFTKLKALKQTRCDLWWLLHATVLDRMAIQDHNPNPAPKLKEAVHAHLICLRPSSSMVRTGSQGLAQASLRRRAVVPAISHLCPTSVTKPRTHPPRKPSSALLHRRFCCSCWVELDA